MSRKQFGTVPLAGWPPIAVLETSPSAGEFKYVTAFLMSLLPWRTFLLIQLLQNGLKDTSEMVLNGCVNGLLRNWILECDDGNFINLLSRLDVESFTDVRCESFPACVFSRAREMLCECVGVWTCLGEAVWQAWHWWAGDQHVCSPCCFKSCSQHYSLKQQPP